MPATRWWLYYVALKHPTLTLADLVLQIYYSRGVTLFMPTNQGLEWMMAILGLIWYFDILYLQCLEDDND